MGFKESWDRNLEKIYYLTLRNIEKETYSKSLYKEWKNTSERLRLKYSDLEFKLIIDQYTQKHRAYHTLSHIANMLTESEKVKESIENIDELKFAIFMHDIIYDKYSYDKKPNNEEKSIAHTMSLNMPIKYAEEISKLIQVTDHKTIPETNNQKIIVDLDLAILGKSKEIFDKYERGIRYEYNEYDKEMYTSGRIRFLEKILERKNIYNTEYFKEQYESSARKNIEHQILKLGNKQ